MQPDSAWPLPMPIRRERRGCRSFETQEIAGLIFAWWGAQGREPQWRLPARWYAGPSRVERHRAQDNPLSRAPPGDRGKLGGHGPFPLRPRVRQRGAGRVGDGGRALPGKLVRLHERQEVRQNWKVHHGPVRHHPCCRPGLLLRGDPRAVHWSGYAALGAGDSGGRRPGRPVPGLAGGRAKDPRRRIAGLGFLPTGWRAPIFNKFMAPLQKHDVLQDVVIWRRKRYQTLPRLCGSDGEIMLFRAYCAQFYASPEAEEIPVSCHPGMDRVD